MAQSSHSLHHLPMSIDTDSIIERVRGAVTFKRSTIAGIAADRKATLEAAIVVAIVGLATAIGGRDHLVDTTVDVMVGWAMLAGVIWYLADRVLGTPTSRESFLPLLRSTGFALAPAVLSVVGFIWGLGAMVSGFGTLWSFIATIVAVQITTRFGWPRAIALTLAGGIVVNVAAFIINFTTGINPQVW